MATTIKVNIKTKCEYCNGEAYVRMGEAQSYTGDIYPTYAPCKYCEGTGERAIWIGLAEFSELLNNTEINYLINPGYKVIGKEEPISQYQDSRDSAGI